MIRAEKARNQNDCGAVSARHPETVVDGRGMQHQKLNRKQNFTPDGNIRFLIIACEYVGASVGRTQVGSFH
jgi:polygalacturonase